jgi:non-canonical purine NTP pyrophosphatase (RdgB/HAM1 family)
VLALTFVTANPNKLAEAKAILPWPVTSISLDITEIQTLDLDEIINHKLQEAFKQIGSPVIVDDVSAELESLNGLPGPFIKFFEQKLGPDALFKLTQSSNERAKIICCLGYYDGQKTEIVKGILHGKVVAPRGDNGWGFDKVIVPDGHNRTMAEMSPEVKNTLSHRYLALTQLSEKLII